MAKQHFFGSSQQLLSVCFPIVLTKVVTIASSDAAKTVFDIFTAIMHIKMPR